MSTEVIKHDFSLAEKKMLDLGLSPEQVKREISFAKQMIAKNGQLQKCSMQSLLQSVLNVANIGLTLNPAAKEGYLLPRYNSMSKQVECVFEPSYIGLIKLLTDSGSVSKVNCQLVFSGDHISINIADSNHPIRHIIDPSKRRGDIIGVYAVATIPNVGEQAEFMSLEEVQEIRERSDAWKAFKDGKMKSCTWESDFGEMMRKTVIKRIYKYLPRTDKMEKVDEAIQIDDSDYRITYSQMDYIESLLNSCCLDEDRRDDIRLELNVMSSRRASEVIEYLKDNQLDPVTHGGNPSPTQITKHLKKL